SGATPTPEVRLQPTASEVQVFAMKMQSEQESWVTLPRSQAAKLKAKYTSAGLTSQSGLVFVTKSAIALQVSPEMQMLRIPVSGGQSVEPQSSISVFFDMNGKLLDTTEFVFTAVSESSRTVHAWSGSTPVLNQLVSAPG